MKRLLAQRLNRPCTHTARARRRRQRLSWRGDVQAGVQPGFDVPMRDVGRQPLPHTHFADWLVTRGRPFPTAGLAPRRADYPQDPQKTPSRTLAFVADCGIQLVGRTMRQAPSLRRRSTA
jgi:hypothetical protein